MVSRKVIRADNFPDANSIILIIAMMYDGDLMRVRKPWRPLLSDRSRRPRDVTCAGLYGGDSMFYVYPGTLRYERTEIWRHWEQPALSTIRSLPHTAQPYLAYLSCHPTPPPAPFLTQPLQAVSRLLTSFLPFSLFFFLNHTVFCQHNLSKPF